jgi:hypothetical protein
MDFQTHVENERFLLLFGPPYKSVCNYMTLKTGVIFLSICDLMIGVMNLILFIFSVIPFLNQGYRNPFYYLELFDYIINIAGIMFAFIGLRGMAKLNIDGIELYYKFEVFELFFEGLLRLIKVYYYQSTINVHGNILFEVLIELFFIFISAMVTKVIWSTLIRLKNNEAILVMHGEAVLHLMEQQAANLANPKVITPNMPIYIT